MKSKESKIHEEQLCLGYSYLGSKPPNILGQTYLVKSACGMASANQ